VYSVHIETGQRPTEKDTKMTNLEIAIAQFADLNRAMVAFWKGEAAEPVDADYGYKHGWVTVNGESFSSRVLHPGCAEQPYMD